jgi:glycosyltransferase involved in cell wall biosynthesis
LHISEVDFLVAACDISVVIPALNEEKYLARCLNSLVCQSRKDPVEIIVVDGGSTDRTIQVAKEYAHKVLVELARPVGAARNIGAKQAEGEVLAFIDADTIACEEWLEEIAGTFDSNPGAVGVTGPTLPYEGTHLDRIVYHVAPGWVQRFSLMLRRQPWSADCGGHPKRCISLPLGFVALEQAPGFF